MGHQMSFPSVFALSVSVTNAFLAAPGTGGGRHTPCALGTPGDTVIGEQQGDQLSEVETKSTHLGQT